MFPPTSLILRILDLVCCRTNGSQKYFTLLVPAVDNANLSLHRATFPALDAAPTNVNGESYVLNISYLIPPPAVMDVICESNEGIAFWFPFFVSHPCRAIAASKFPLSNNLAVNTLTLPFSRCRCVCLLCPSV